MNDSAAAPRPLPVILSAATAPALVAAYVLITFTATPNPMMALWRPLLVGIAAGVVLQVLLTLIVRNVHRAGLVAGVLTMLALGAWLLLAAALAAALWLFLVQRMRCRRGQPRLAVTTTAIAKNLAVFALALVAIAVVPVAGWWWTSGAPSEPARTTLGTAGQDDPDIVVLLLDGYPRSDALLEQFGATNRSFEQALGARGFRVAVDSRSNYSSTRATLLSMFYGRYVHEIASLSPAPSDPAEQYRRVMLALADAPLLSELHRDGYEVVTVPSSIDSAALISADRILTPPQWSSFELSLLQHSLLGRAIFTLAPDVVFDQHRARLEATFELATEEAATMSDRPRFVFAHVMAPHPPIVWDADGSEASPVACFPDCSIFGLGSEADWSAFPGQVSTLNRLVLNALDEIITANPDAMVIVMSDHGSRRTGADAANAFRNFFAARIPDGRVRFADDVTPLTMISRLTDAGATAADPYRAWHSGSKEPLTLRPYAGPLP